MILAILLAISAIIISVLSYFLFVKKCPGFCPACPDCPANGICPKCPDCPNGKTCPMCPDCPSGKTCPTCPACPSNKLCPKCPNGGMCPICPRGGACPLPINQKKEEVFLVSVTAGHPLPNKFNMSQYLEIAKLVDGKLATVDELKESMMNGASECGSGWVTDSNGKHVSFYPTNIGDKYPVGSWGSTECTKSHGSKCACGPNKQLNSYANSYGYWIKAIKPAKKYISSSWKVSPFSQEQNGFGTTKWSRF